MSIPAEFLETYPLYRKLFFEEEEVPVGYPPINRYCPVCRASQTFTRVIYGAGTVPNFSSVGGGSSLGGSPSQPKDVPRQHIDYVEYECASCKEFRYHFLVKTQDGKGVEKSYVMKVGQEPPWEISIDKDLAKALGKDVEIFKKGLICESQGYGIGAFVYYRRVVEDLIEELLRDIAAFINDSDLSQYQEALLKAQETPIVSEKIKLVKDLLPDVLRPGRINPLDVLYKALSVGVHQLQDEECLEMAETVRGAISYLVVQVSVYRQNSKEFAEKMQNLLSWFKG